jgi:hypothetical protein
MTTGWLEFGSTQWLEVLPALQSFPQLMGPIADQLDDNEV